MGNSVAMELEEPGRMTVSSLPRSRSLFWLAVFGLLCGIAAIVSAVVYLVRSAPTPPGHPAASASATPAPSPLGYREALVSPYAGSRYRSASLGERSTARDEGQAPAAANGALDVAADVNPVNGGENVPDALAEARNFALAAARAELIDAHLAEQAHDASFNRDVRTRIDDAVEKLGPEAFPGTRLESLECGTTLCRALIAHGSEAEQLHVAELVLALGMRAFGHRDESQPNQARTLLYLARQGQKLPKPDRERVFREAGLEK
jgi:hypothetical protein